MPITLEEFIEMNDSLLRRSASFYVKTNAPYSIIEFDDLYQVGCLALIKAYSRYDASMGDLYVFSYWVVRSAMFIYIRANSTITHVPANLVVLSKSYIEENEIFYMMNGRYMTVEERACWVKKYKEVKSKNIRELISWLEVVSLYHYRNVACSLDDQVLEYDDYGIDNNDDSSVIIRDLIISDYDLEDELISKEKFEQLLQSMAECLTERDLDIFLEKIGFYDDKQKTNFFLADRYSVTPQRIDQIHHEVLEKLKNKIKTI